MAEILKPDFKGSASLILHDVIRTTRTNHPDPRFHPEQYFDTPYYSISGIDTHGFTVYSDADGAGTKPELAERLFTDSKDPSNFETLAYDTIAMIDGDAARFGKFTVGIVNTIDVNKADPNVVEALARGLERACNEGKFALLNGETAENGYRTSGYGNTHLNWTATSLYLINKEKLLLGDRLEPGQPIVAFREESIRSNGLTRAREILESLYLVDKLYWRTKEAYVVDWFRKNGMDIPDDRESDRVFIEKLNILLGHNALEQVLLPWHTEYPEIAKQLHKPSRLYSPVMYDAQGGIDGVRKVDMIAAAHITGGGIPEKGKRMVQGKGLGITVENVFSDPEAVTSLLQSAKKIGIYSAMQELGMENAERADITASEQWNRGVGFMVVVSNREEAKKLINIASDHDVEAAVAGEVIEKPQVEFRGHTWEY